jgi:hypothetical protein
MANNKLLCVLLSLTPMVFSNSVARGQGGDSRGNNSPTTVQTPEVPKPAVLSEPPVNSPSVVCDHGQLTISASNSTLASILAEVHRCIGAKIDAPDGAGASRVFEELGPGPAREVLSALLNATAFNYVIGSSESDPGKVETIVLTAKVSDGAGESVDDRTMTPARRAYLRMRQGGRSNGSSEDVDTSEHTDAAEPPVKDDVAPAPADSAAANAGQSPTGDPPTTTSQTSAAAEASPSASPLGAGQGGTQGDSTERKITNMQQLFEQRRQMIQQQQNAPPEK